MFGELHEAEDADKICFSVPMSGCFEPPSNLDISRCVLTSGALPTSPGVSYHKMLQNAVEVYLMVSPSTV
jgi:hypothetical protein